MADGKNGKLSCIPRSNDFACYSLVVIFRELFFGRYSLIVILWARATLVAAAKNFY
jgi:hypothetical protein